MERSGGGILSEPGILAEIGKVITAEVLAQGGTDDDVRAILTNRELQQQMAALTIAARPNAEEDSGSDASPEKTYPVTVPEGVTFMGMVREGWYDILYNKDLMDDHLSDRNLGPTGSFNLELLHFGYDISIETAEKNIRELNYKPATLGMLLAFGAKYLDEIQFPVICLGTHFWHLYSFMCYLPFVEITEENKKRMMGVGYCKHGYRGHCRWLVYREAPRTMAY